MTTLHITGHATATVRDPTPSERLLQAELARLRLAAWAVVCAFQALGRSKDAGSRMHSHMQCEAAMMALDSALKNHFPDARQMVPVDEVVRNS